MTLTYACVCSGISAATVAWHPLGMRPKFFAEISDFPVPRARLPDGYTAIEGARDSARYAAIGNSIAVPCLRWIGDAGHVRCAGGRVVKRAEVE